MPRKLTRKIMKRVTEMSNNTVNYEKLHDNSSVIDLGKRGVCDTFAKLSSLGARKLHGWYRQLSLP